MSKITSNIDMNGNKILNCETIKELEKRVAELELKLSVQPKDTTVYCKVKNQSKLIIDKKGYLSCEIK